MTTFVAQHEAEAVLNFLDDSHRWAAAGSFTRALIDTACKADRSNLERLRSAFPGIVTAVDMYKNMPNGVDVLRAIASGEAH